MTGELYAVLALLLFSGNVFLVRPASARISQPVGFLVLLLANVAIASLLAGGQELLRRETVPLDYPAVGAFAVAGVFANYLGRWGYFRTVQAIGPSRASAIQSSSPLFAVAFAWLALSQELGVSQLLPMGLVVVGLCLAGSTEQGRDGSASGAPRLPRREVMVAVGAAAAYAVGNVLRGGAVDRWHEPVLGALVGAAGATLAYVTMHRRELLRRGVLRDLPRDGLVLWALSGMTMICAQTALIAATAYLPVGVVVAVSTATPVIVIPLSVLMLGNREQVTGRVATGAALITGGVATLLLH